MVFVYMNATHSNGFHDNHDNHRVECTTASEHRASIDMHDEGLRMPVRRDNLCQLNWQFMQIIPRDNKFRATHSN